MLCLISLSQRCGSEDLERIHRIALRQRADIGLQRLACDHIDRLAKEFGDIVLKPNIGVDVPNGLGIDIDQKVDVAVGTIVAAHSRTEQGGMGDTTLTQGVFVLPKPIENLLSVHGSNLARNWFDLQASVASLKHAASNDRR